MFGEALLSALNQGQMLHAAEKDESAEQLKNKVCVACCTARGASHFLLTVPCADTSLVTGVCVQSSGAS
jgi:sulfur relay (sulfurtransferase) complex TusBCD TusD component (DsrE family)